VAKSTRNGLKSLYEGIFFSRITLAERNAISTQVVGGRKERRSRGRVFISPIRRGTTKVDPVERESVPGLRVEADVNRQYSGDEERDVGH